MVPSEHCEGESVLPPLPASGGLLAIFGSPWRAETSHQSLPQVPKAFSMCVSVGLCPNSPFL